MIIENIEDWKEVKDVYELTTAISIVSDPSSKTSKHTHLVAQIKVTDDYYYGSQKSESAKFDNRGWFVMNDFYISPSSPKEVVDFSFKVCWHRTKKRKKKSFLSWVGMKISLKYNSRLAY